MMGFEQRIIECPDHGAACTLIVGELDGQEVWRSHMSSDVPPEVRLNLEYPEAEDAR